MDLEAIDGATTIVLRGVSEDCKPEQIAIVLDQLQFGYDFIYCPQDQSAGILPNKKKKRGLSGLCFINFISPEEAALAARCFLEHAPALADVGLKVRSVAKSQVQGLGPNLARFVITSGELALRQSWAPLVFKNGVRVTDLAREAYSFVTLEMLEEAFLESQFAAKGQSSEAGDGSRMNTMMEPRYRETMDFDTMNLPLNSSSASTNRPAHGNDMGMSSNRRAFPTMDFDTMTLDLNSSSASSHRPAHGNDMGMSSNRRAFPTTDFDNAPLHGDIGMSSNRSFPTMDFDALPSISHHAAHGHDVGTFRGRLRTMELPSSSSSQHAAHGQFWQHAAHGQFQTAASAPGTWGGQPGAEGFTQVWRNSQMAQAKQAQAKPRRRLPTYDRAALPTCDFDDLGEEKILFDL